MQLIVCLLLCISLVLMASNGGRRPPSHKGDCKRVFGKKYEYCEYTASCMPVENMSKYCRRLDIHYCDRTGEVVPDDPRKPMFFCEYAPKRGCMEEDAYRQYCYEPEGTRDLANALKLIGIVEKDGIKTFQRKFYKNRIVIENDKNSPYYFNKSSDDVSADYANEAEDGDNPSKSDSDEKNGKAPGDDGNTTSTVDSNASTLVDSVDDSSPSKEKSETPDGDGTTDHSSNESDVNSSGKVVGDDVSDQQHTTTSDGEGVKEVQKKAEVDLEKIKPDEVDVENVKVETDVVEDPQDKVKTTVENADSTTKSNEQQDDTSSDYVQDDTEGMLELDYEDSDASDESVEGYVYARRTARDDKAGSDHSFGNSAFATLFIILVCLVVLAATAVVHQSSPDDGKLKVGV